MGFFSMGFVELVYSVTNVTNNLLTSPNGSDMREWESFCWIAMCSMKPKQLSVKVEFSYHQFVSQETMVFSSRKESKGKKVQ